MGRIAVQIQGFSRDYAGLNGNRELTVSRRGILSASLTMGEDANQRRRDITPWAVRKPRETERQIVNTTFALVSRFLLLALQFVPFARAELPSGIF